MTTAQISASSIRNTDTSGQWRATGKSDPGVRHRKVRRSSCRGPPWDFPLTTAQIVATSIKKYRHFRTMVAHRKISPGSPSQESPPKVLKGPPLGLPLDWRTQVGRGSCSHNVFPWFAKCFPTAVDMNNSLLDKKYRPRESVTGKSAEVPVGALPRTSP